MAKILGGRVTVPHAECALQWHALLSFMRLADNVYSTAVDQDWLTAAVLMQLVARDYGPAVQEAQKTLTTQDVTQAQRALDKMLDEVAPDLMKEIIDCECKGLR